MLGLDHVKIKYKTKNEYLLREYKLNHEVPCHLHNANLHEQQALEYHLSQQSEEVDENLRHAILGFRTLDLLVAISISCRRVVCHGGNRNESRITSYQHSWSKLLAWGNRMRIIIQKHTYNELINIINNATILFHHINHSR